MRKAVAVAVGLMVAGLLLLVGIGMVIVPWGTSTYNNLVTLRESVNAQWGQVQNVYQRRSDLVPNLVATAKGYAKHEKETFTQVAEARSNAGKINLKASDLTPENLKKFQAAQGELSSALSRLLAVQERYPDLKANENFQDLMVQLEGTENRITVERQKFNEVAKEKNTAIGRFPDNLIAMYFKFEKTPYFEAEKDAKQAPKVDFSDPPSQSK